MGTRSVVIGWAAALAVGCSSSSHDATGPTASLDQHTVNAPGPPGSVAGSMQYEGPTGVWTTAEVHAVRMPDGNVAGTFQIRRHLGPLGGAKVHGRITCLTIEGNEAWVGGVIEKALDPASIGMPYGFRAVDNGEGATDPPDQWARTRNIPSATDYCANKPLTPLLPVTAGNIQVRGQ